MNMLQGIENLGLGLDWPTLLAGWRGINSIKISANEVITYATNYLSTNPENESPALIQLVIARPDECDEISKSLYKLASESSDFEEAMSIAYRKWRILLLVDLISTLKTENHVDGLMELTDFWAGFDFPEDMPHIVQGRGNSITPQEYYCNENYIQLLEAHKRWIENEKKVLGKLRSR